MDVAPLVILGQHDLDLTLVSRFPVCVRAYVRACMRACMRAYVHTCVRIRARACNATSAAAHLTAGTVDCGRRDTRKSVPPPPPPAAPAPTHPRRDAPRPRVFMRAKTNVRTRAFRSI